MSLKYYWARFKLTVKIALIELILLYRNEELFFYSYTKKKVFSLSYREYAKAKKAVDKNMVYNLLEYFNGVPVEIGQSNFSRLIEANEAMYLQIGTEFEFCERF